MDEPDVAVAKLLTPSHNYAVVQLPGRQFPGVVFQGDSLSILCADAVDAENAAVGTAAHELVSSLREDLDSVLLAHIRVLEANNIEIPFQYRPRPAAPDA